MNLTPDNNLSSLSAKALPNRGQVIEGEAGDPQLRESERRFRTLIENALDMHSVVGPDGTILYESPSAEHLTGYKADELVGTRIVDRIHPDDAPGIAALFSRVIESGSDRQQCQYRYRHRDGSWRVFESIGKSYVDENGNCFVIVSTRDITQRERDREELIRSEERYRDLVENARDIIYTQDLNGKYTSVNNAVEKILGYTCAEALQLSSEQITAPEYHNRVREMIKSKLAGQRETVYDVEVIAKDGSRVALEVSTRLIFQEGVPVGVQGIARDVTERKQLEEQLRQAQKMEAVGQLAGGVAHDFNNLLTAIMGYSDLALYKLNAGDPLRHNLEEIKKAGTRAASLTRQLLAFSRKQVLQPKVLDLNVVLSEMQRMLGRLIGENIELHTVLAPDLGRVKADPGQIEQVVMNLAVNARDAMPRGGKLTIETENVFFDHEYSRQHISALTGQYVMLSVSDTGAGMDEKTQARVFEPFFTTKEVGRGTGLGLSTVYGIIKQSGGYIWLYSEPGQGTTFKIYLPRVDEVAQKLEQRAGAEEQTRGTETILIAEDEETVRRMAREVLEMYGYRVLKAPHGQAALVIAERYEEPIDLLITDVVMPEMSGDELAARLAVLRPRMKVLYMSGYTHEAIVHHGVLHKGTNFIQKPFGPDALARKVRALLDS